jgi:hypothetical protein
VAASCSGLGSGGWVLVWGGQGCLGGGQVCQSGLPAGFQTAGDQTVFWFAGVEGAFGAVGVVLGTLHCQVGGPGGAGAAGGDFAGGGQGQGDLIGANLGQQRPGDGVIDGVGAYRAAQRCGDVVGAGVAAFVVGAPVSVADLHGSAAGAAEHDALAQGCSFSGWAGAGVGAVGGQFRLDSQELLPAGIGLVVVVNEDLPLLTGKFGG